MMRFDWYAATLPDKIEHVLATLHSGLGGEVKETRGLHGYTHGFQILGEGGIRAQLLCGGVNIHPHAWASGQRTDEFVKLVRGHWPGNHNVTRLDSAEDFAGDGTWEKLSSACLGIADELGLKVQHAGDFHRCLDGRTLYIGSKKSPCFVRLYEKGKQMRSQNPYSVEQIPLDWVRLEAQIRTDKSNRQFASTISPLDAWGFSRTTRSIAKACFDPNIDRIDASRYRKSDDERALEHVCAQYGKILERLRLRLGSWAAVGEKIGSEIARIEQKRIKRRCDEDNV